MAQFYYDNQIRRFLIQCARVFSDWYVTKGKDPQGNDILVRVPIMYGDSSRQASTIIANNSASSLPSAPLITYYITGLEYDQRRTQDPYFVDKLAVRRQTYNSETQSFETTQGDAFTVERIMPVPYTLRVTVDFWTTNYNQKLELIEQLGVLFNPSMEIQSTDNFIDWTSLSVIYQEGLTFSSRTIPVGSGNPIDVMSWKFYMPIWISSPTKVKKLGVIHKIIASIFQGNAITDMQDDDLLLGTRQKITPYGYKILLLGNMLQLLPEGTSFNPNNETLDIPNSPDTDLYWKSFLNVYGTVRPGISQIWLQNPHMATDIVGTIAFNPVDDRTLIYNIDSDTLPQNTLQAVNSVINPRMKGPNAGLPPASNGQRYLIVNSIGVSKKINYEDLLMEDGEMYATENDEVMVLDETVDNPEPTIAWGNIVANANDIIEFDGSQNKWIVSFDSQSTTNSEYVTNLTSGIQYRFSDNVWTKSYEGFYEAGDFSIVI